MDLDRADRVPDTTHDAPALRFPLAAAQPLADEILIERLEGHARAAHGAFAAGNRIFAA